MGMREKERSKMISEWEEMPFTKMGKILGEPPTKTAQVPCM